MSTEKNTPRMLMVLLLSVLFLLPSFLIFVNSEDIYTTVEDLNNASSGCDSLRPTRAPQFKPVLVCNEPGPEPQMKHAYPKGLVTFNCTVTNEGDIYDDYVVDSTQIQGWDIIIYPDKFPRIPPLSSPENDTNKIKKRTVRIVVGRMSNATVGNYSIEVTLRSSLSINTSKINFTVSVLPLHSVDIISPSQKSRLPGEVAMYEFQIWNTGNVNDTYEIWLESSDPDWSVILVDDTMETLELHIGKGVVAPVIVFIPQDADAGYVHRTTFAARLKGEPPAHVERGTVETTIGNITRIEVDQDARERTKNGIPGDEITFTFEITNKGNNLDPIIGSPGTFLLSRSPATPVNWDTSIDSSSVNDSGLEKSLAVEIYFSVRIPPLMPAGTYEFVVDIYSDIPMTHQDRASFKVNVLTFYDIEMEIKETSKNGDIGDNVSFTALLNNTGNIRDTYNWGVVSDYASWIWMGEPTFTVDFGYPFLMLFNVRIPMNAPVGSYVFRLTLLSEGDENISFEQSFEVKVAETMDFSLSVLNETFDVVIGSEILVPFKVANVGNADLPLSLDIFGEPWGILEHKNPFLRIGELKELTIFFNPPRGIEPGEYSFLIIGDIITKTGAEKIITVNINVKQPLQMDEYFEILFSGEAFELGIEGEFDNITVGPLGNSDDFSDLWPSIQDNVFQERYVVSGTSRLDMTVGPEGESFIGDISDEYSLVIMKVHGEDRAAMVLEEISYANNSEEHSFAIEWLQIDGPYSMLFTRTIKDTFYQISTKDMVMDRNESDTYNLLFHDDEYDLVITKVKADGNSLAVCLKDIPLGDSDRTDYKIDWLKVMTDKSDAVILSYRDEGGNVVSKFTLSPVSTGSDLLEGEVDDTKLSMQNLSFIIGIVIFTILLGMGVVVKGKNIRNRNMLTRYSVMGIISMKESGITFEDIYDRMGLIKNRMKLDEKIIKSNLINLIGNDYIYTKSIRGILHYYVKDNEPVFRFEMK